MLNVMPIITLKKLGRNKSDLISTNMKINNFTREIMVAIEVLVANIMIHSIQSIPLTLHQLLMFWE